MKGSQTLPILRSDTQGRMLARLLLAPGTELSLTELARDAGTSVPTALREVDRAERAGVVRSRRVGNVRLISADMTSPLFEPLAELLLKSFGPPRVIADAFAGLRGVERIYIFGSWAARYLGDSGPNPRDIDVLLVGKVDRDAAYESAADVERRLGRRVNVTVRSGQRWSEASDPFIQELLNRPMIQVFPEEDALGVVSR